MKRLLAVLSLFALMFAGCDSGHIEKLEDGDVIQVSVFEPGVDNSGFNLRFSSSLSYGCDAQLAYRFAVAKNNAIVFDLLGVDGGDSGCSSLPQAATERVTRRFTERNYTLSIRHDKKADEYSLQLLTDGTWQLEKTANDGISNLTAVAASN